MRTLSILLPLLTLVASVTAAPTWSLARTAPAIDVEIKEPAPVARRGIPDIQLDIEPPGHVARRAASGVVATAGESQHLVKKSLSIPLAKAAVGSRHVDRRDSSTIKF